MHHWSPGRQFVVDGDSVDEPHELARNAKRGCELRPGEQELEGVTNFRVYDYVL